MGEERYHDKHPFHRRLVAGTLDRAAVQAWVANRYYYQKQIPVKDAAILGNLPSAAYRRAWISRIYDHDGAGDGEGGGPSRGWRWREPSDSTMPTCSQNARSRRVRALPSMPT